MNSNVLIIQPSGIVTGLYTETIPLATLGVLSVRRLTQIEFNGATQQWEVKDQTGNLLFSDPSRAQCLQWEHRQFNR